MLTILISKSKHKHLSCSSSIRPMVEAKHLEDSSPLQSREGLPITGCFSKSFHCRHMLSIGSVMLVDLLPGPYSSWALQPWLLSSLLMLIAELHPHGDWLAHAAEIYSTRGLEKILQGDSVECPLPRLYIQRCYGMQSQAHPIQSQPWVNTLSIH